VLSKQEHLAVLLVLRAITLFHELNLGGGALLRWAYSMCTSIRKCVCSFFISESKGFHQTNV